MPGGPERVQEALRKHGLDIKVLRLPASTRTAVEASRAVGCDVGAIAKSLVFMADGEPVLVICAGDRRVDTERVAHLLGAASVQMAPAEEVRRITGFAIGGVPPIGHVTPMTIIMDTALLRWDTIYAAAGAHDALFSIAPRRLLEVTGARLADIGIPT